MEGHQTSCYFFLSADECILEMHSAEKNEHDLQG